MRWRLLANLHLMILLPLALLGWGLLSIGASPQWAAAGGPESMLAWDHDRVTGGADGDRGVPNYRTDSIVSQLIARPTYTTATLLLEDVGGSTSALLLLILLTPTRWKAHWAPSIS
jgi:hypothetical protein